MQKGIAICSSEFSLQFSREKKECDYSVGR